MDTLTLTFLIYGFTHLSLLIIILAQGRLSHLLKLTVQRPLLHLVGGIGAALTLMLYWGIQLTGPTEAAVVSRSDLMFSLILGVVIWHYHLHFRDFAGLAVMLVGIFLVLDLSWTGFHVGSTGDLWLFFSAFLVAVNAEIIKISFRDLDGIVIAFFNSGVQAVIYLLLVVLMGNTQALYTLNSFAWSLIGVSVVMQVIQYLSYYVGIRELPVWKIRVLGLVSPVMTMVTSVWWLQTGLKWTQIIGVIIVGAGVAIITIPSSNGCKQSCDRNRSTI